MCIRDRAHTGLHGLFILITEDARTAARANKGSDRIKRIREAERENRDQHQRDLRRIREQGRCV